VSEQTPSGAARADWDVSAPAAFALEPLAAPPGVVVLRLVGEFDVAACGGLREHLDRALAASVRAVVFDLEEVAFIDSSALRELIRAQAALRQAEGVVVLAAAGGAVRRLLELTGTAELFTRAATRDEGIALASAQASGERPR